MSFLISKIVGALIAPMSLLALVLLCVLMLQRRRPRLARALLAISLLFVASLSLMPIGHWTLWPLETRFAKPDEGRLAHVDGIIVLGGVINTRDSGLSGDISMNDAAERLTTFITLSKQYPDAKLVFTGGSAAAWGNNVGISESVGAQSLLEALGIDKARTIYERDSRNTWENAVFSKKIVDPKPSETWLLVTSAWHMPRSVGIFRKVGWPVVPYPVDFLSADPDAWARFEAPSELESVSFAVRETVGLISYHLLGRTDAFFPSPTNAASPR